jgi:hypothetical protein
MRGPWQRRKRSDKKVDGLRLVGIGVFVLVAFAWAASVIIINQRLPDHPTTATTSVENQVPLRLRHYTSEEELLLAKQQRVEWMKRNEENEKEDDASNDRDEEPRQQQETDHVQPSEVVFFLLTSSSFEETAGEFRSGYEERIEAAMETWASECHLIAFCV